MTPKAKRDRAKQLVNDELMTLARDEILGSINKELLLATTPEDREAKWQEYHGLKRAWGRLAVWAAEADTH